MERYRLALAVWFDRTAIAIVSTKSQSGLTKMAVAPCLSKCLASFSKHFAVSPSLLDGTESPRFAVLQYQVRTRGNL